MKNIHENRYCPICGGVRGGVGRHKECLKELVKLPKPSKMRTAKRLPVKSSDYLAAKYKGK